MREVSYFSRVAGRVEGPILRPPRRLFGSLPGVEEQAASERRGRKAADRPANARDKAERAGEAPEPRPEARAPRPEARAPRPEAPEQGKIAPPKISPPMLFKEKAAPAEVPPFTPGLDAAPRTVHVRSNPAREGQQAAAEGSVLHIATKASGTMHGPENSATKASGTGHVPENSATKASGNMHGPEITELADRSPAMDTGREPGPMRTDPPNEGAGAHATPFPAGREPVEAKRDLDAGETRHPVLPPPRMPAARKHFEPAEPHARTRPESLAAPAGAGDERIHIGSLEIRIVPAQPPQPQAQPAPPVLGKMKAASKPLSRSFPTYGLAQAY